MPQRDAPNDLLRRNPLCSLEREQKRIHLTHSGAPCSGARGGRSGGISMIFRKLKSMRDSALLGLTGIAAGLLVSGGAGLAEGAGEGHAVPGQMGLQRGTTPIAHEMHWFHDQLLLPIITVVCLFVLGLLVWVALKFNEKAHPVPSRPPHTSFLEAPWRFIPLLIRSWMAIPPFGLSTSHWCCPVPAFR